MKKRFKYLILSACLLLFIFCAVLYFKSNLRSPEFISIEKIEYIETIGPEVFFNAHANFYNPNNFEAQILNSELELISKDLEVAKISQSNISKVKAHSNFNVEFKFKINLAQLSVSHGLSGVLANILSEEKEIPVHFTGYTRFRSRGQVYKIPIEFDQILKFK